MMMILIVGGGVGSSIVSMIMMIFGFVLFDGTNGIKDAIFKSIQESTAGCGSRTDRDISSL